MNKSNTTLGSTRDTVFIAVTEVMGIIGDDMAKHPSDVLLTISLSGGHECAVVGGALTADAIDRLKSLLCELKRRQAAEGDSDKTLHVWR
ncbi:hypothetical protein LCG56_26850 [Pseudomonas cannabina pv. alisalensis]|uniref:Uncharacterized protein n=1 Tax=Pseudomonas syringae pv. maculicola str. ES4326 TaxID=629265 RepID=A0A8T8C0E1_PSEYM|nr:MULTISPECIES: hypothetical protein [Pseudomonas syringae group]QHE96846.1 hypothetical protein PMA4326_009570 [Pseudomonas syringae pv. maculicola str. ES4326]UBY97505.1 hypothetical protein LCG56_26850 [Pseudomonas cannabina pv. alisalensis]